MIFILLMIFVRSTNSLNCSDDLKYGYTLTNTTIAATLPQFLSIVGSFYNDTWYNYPVNSTNGPDNQVNSTRIISDSTNTLIFYETLIEYKLNETYFKQSWTGPGDAIKTDDFGSFILGSYIETLTGESTCRRSAVLINFAIEFCATNISEATIVLTEGHVIGIQQVQKLLGAGNFTTCPSNASFNKSRNLFITILTVLFWII